MPDQIHQFSISNQDLTFKLRSLIAKEREVTLQILELIIEAERRRVFSEAGRSSLFEWLTKDLGYSEGAAQRRIESARLLRAVPEVAIKIESGSLSLTNLAKIGSTLRRVKSSKTKREQKAAFDSSDFSKTATELMGLVEGKSSRQAEAVLAERFPEIPKPDLIRNLDSENFQAQITFTRAQKEKLERVREIASHHGASFADLIEIATDEFLRRRDPLVREVKPRDSKNRGRVRDLSRDCSSDRDREKVTAGAGGEKRNALASPRAATRVSERQPYSPKSSSKFSRTKLAPSIRNLVYRRAGASCEFRDFEKNRRCSARVGLEIDHIKPVSLGGGNEIENLRVLCREHNQLEAARWFGAEKLQTYRDDGFSS